MMNRTVPHYPGNHCASTGLRNIVNFHGFSWSEPVCFGIGAGLGIWYMGSETSSPSRMLHVRSADIEQQFFTRIGASFTWERFENPIAAEKALCQILDKRIPAILQSDIYHLPYYNSSTHFPGHVITAWDYDAETQELFVTDTEREVVLAVPFEAMRKARFCQDSYFSIQGNFYAPESLKLPENLPDILRKSIVYNSRVLMDQKMDFQGITALRKWKEEMDVWETFEDWQWTARFAYQVIEKRGTGGGGFRKMYAEFLEQAAEILPAIHALGLPERMRQASSAWSALAESLKAASDEDHPEFSDVGVKLAAVIREEKSYHTAALDLV